MLEIKEKLIRDTIEFTTDKFPKKDMTVVQNSLNSLFDSVLNDIENNTTISSATFGSNKWHAGKYLGNQKEDREIHTEFFTLLKTAIPAERGKIDSLEDAVVQTVNGSPFHKKKFEVSDKKTYLADVMGIARNRHNYKPLTGSVDPKDLELILEAASGVTPALSNEYNYRVDVVPDKYKQDLYEQTKNYSQEAAKTGNEGYARDENPQLLAPVLLCYSLRYNVNDTSIEQFCGPMTDRDPNIMNVGLNAWHTIMVAEGLGYNTAFCQMTKWKRDKCKEILGLDDPNDNIHTDYVLERNGKLEFMPLMFIGIGSAGSINSNTRSYKRENIINTLTFK